MKIKQHTVINGNTKKNNMKKITITVGISGSGKSTWAHEQWKADPLNTVLINRDKIRELLFGYTEMTVHQHYSDPNIGKLEKQVTKYEDTLIHEALAEGKHVIVDATHLKRAFIERFKFWNVLVEIKQFDVPLAIAIQRDSLRQRQVGVEVIRRQYIDFRSLGLKDDEFLYPVENIKSFADLPPVYLLDIDGTIAHMNGKRGAFDWKNVGVDDLDLNLSPVIDALNRLKYHKVIVVSGRDGICQPETLKWLTDNGIEHEELYMRAVGDMRPDWQIKEEIWRELSEKYNILGLFDDRMQVVRRARALGLKVFQVEYNNF